MLNQLDVLKRISDGAYHARFAVELDASWRSDSFHDAVDLADALRLVERGSVHGTPVTGRIAFSIPYTLHGDFVGDLVAQSNCETVWEEIEGFCDDEDTCEMVERSFAFDSHELYVFADSISSEAMLDKILEIVSALESYPLFDEDHHSRLEMEVCEECWCDYGESDFLREVCALLEIDDFDRDDLTCDLGELPQACHDLYGDAFHAEGKGFYFDVERLARVACADPQWVADLRAQIKDGAA